MFSEKRASFSISKIWRRNSVLVSYTWIDDRYALLPTQQLTHLLPCSRNRSLCGWQHARERGAASRLLGLLGNGLVSNSVEPAYIPVFLMVLGYVYYPSEIINNVLFHLENSSLSDKLYGLPMNMREISALLSSSLWSHKLRVWCLEVRQPFYDYEGESQDRIRESDPKLQLMLELQCLWIWQ